LWIKKITISICSHNEIWLKKVAAMAKLSVGQALLKAKSHGKKGEFEEAQKLYQTVLQAFPKNKRAQQGLAALNKPKQSTTTQGPPQETINQLVNIYNQGQLAAVVEQAQVLTEQYPKAFIIWNVLGVAHKGLGKTFEASEAFKKVTELNPTYADGHNNYGVTLQEQGKLEEAIEAYNKALAIKPDYADAYYNMGNALKDQGKLEQAIEAYKKTLALKPDYAEAYNNMGVALKDQGKLEEAIEAYKKALSLKPDYVDVARNLVKLPINSIDEQTILELNKKLSLISANIDDQSQKLFFEANLFSHKGMYEEAFKIFVDANSLKSEENILSVKSVQKQYDAAINRISRWSVNLQSEEKAPVKKLFLLGPSRSGKSTLEKLLTGSPNVCPMYENINLQAADESERSTEEFQKRSMVDLFYHDEKNLYELGYNLITSTSPETMFQIDRLIDMLSNSFCIFVKRNRIDIAAEIFIREYRKGYLYSYDHSTIFEYLDAYESIWEIIKHKVSHLTLEISFEDILSEPLETIKKISQMTGVSLELSNPPNRSITNLRSPFREHYASRFMAP
jgi:tetratricopeptide (TPR) repeat protein